MLEHLLSVGGNDETFSQYLSAIIRFGNLPNRKFYYSLFKKGEKKKAFGRISLEKRPWKEARIFDQKKAPGKKQGNVTWKNKFSGKKIPDKAMETPKKVPK